MGNLPFALQSPLLRQAGFPHGFFDRRGGVSSPPWDSSARALGVTVERLYVLSQVHGTACRVVSGAEAREEVLRAAGDVLLSRAPGVACGVRTADCVPVLVADERSGAVAAIHSGWRGTVANVTRAAVAALRGLAGHEAALVAAIGPHIQACCFEVGDDVAAELAACSRVGEACVLRGEGRPRVDLRRIVRAQLEAEGVSAIDDVMGCTVCEPARFHSYRRDGAKSGRMLSAIVVRGLAEDPVGRL